MRSQFADHFNHDEDADDYDLDVLNESDPIRTGYKAALDWAGKFSKKPGINKILELGSGTGNLTERLLPANSVTCVDISARMLKIARDKLATHNSINWVNSDILQFLHNDHNEYSLIISSYALHHLTDAEKDIMLARLAGITEADGNIVIVDLMFESAQHKSDYLSSLDPDRDSELIEAINEEFFWDISSTAGKLEELKLNWKQVQFSPLSWGLHIFH